MSECPNCGGIGMMECICDDEKPEKNTEPETNPLLDIPDIKSMLIKSHVWQPAIIPNEEFIYHEVEKKKYFTCLEEEKEKNIELETNPPLFVSDMDSVPVIPFMPITDRNGIIPTGYYTYLAQKKEKE